MSVDSTDIGDKKPQETSIEEVTTDMGQCDRCESYVVKEHGLLTREDEKLDECFPYREGERRICDPCLMDQITKDL